LHRAERALSLVMIVVALIFWKRLRKTSYKFKTG
jgi:hypothetical protein